jgi:prolyl-tRNA synthetase
MEQNFKKFLRDAKLYFDYDTHGNYIFNEAINEYASKITKYWKSLNKECKNIILPTLVQKKIFSKEINAFLNADDSCLYQTNSAYLKATSEPVLYNSQFYRNEIKTKNSLPVKHYMYNRVYRKESRTNPLIRHNEIFMFLEIHEAYIKEVNRQIITKSIVEKYSKLIKEYLRIPALILERPEWDRFNGAESTIAFDTIVDNKRLQIATIHDLGTNFAQLYDLKYLVQKDEYEYVQQFCHGCSERLLYATLYYHYKGECLVLPSHLRLIELILVDYAKPFYDKRINLIHEIKSAKLKKCIKELTMRDSIILISYPDNIELKVIDRKNISYIPQSRLSGYRLKTKFNSYIAHDIELSNASTAFMTPYNETLLFDKDLWGFTLDKKEMYMGPSY